jgi:hypothetical protein
MARSFQWFQELEERTGIVLPIAPKSTVRNGSADVVGRANDFGCSQAVGAPTAGG